MDGKFNIEWAFFDMRHNFSFYNRHNIYKLRISRYEKFKLLMGILKKSAYYVRNYKREKFILLPSFLVRVKDFPRERSYVYCGGGKIIINSKDMTKAIIIKIDTSFLPSGICFFSLDGERFRRSLDRTLNDEETNRYLTRYTRTGDRYLLEDVFKIMTKSMSYHAMAYLSEKVLA